MKSLRPSHASPELSIMKFSLEMRRGEAESLHGQTFFGQVDVLFFVHA